MPDPLGEVRERLEAIRDRHSCDFITEGGLDVVVLCEQCNLNWPCPDRKDAMAALGALEAEQAAEPWKCPKCRCPAGCVCCSPIECYCTESPLNTVGPFGV